jgi:hypothetical protein
MEKIQDEEMRRVHGIYRFRSVSRRYTTMRLAALSGLGACGSDEDENTMRAAGHGAHRMEPEHFREVVSA